MRTLGGVVFVAILAIPATIGCSRDSAPAPSVALAQGGKPGGNPAVGRYQTFQSGWLSPNASNIDCLLDSSTGQVWVLKTKAPAGSGKGEWVLANEQPK